MKESEAIKLPCPMQSRPIINSNDMIILYEVMCNGSKCPVWVKSNYGGADDGYCGLISTFNE